jgi:hypothetical protein
MIDGTGNVGIGTTDQVTDKLFVNGTVDSLDLAINNTSIMPSLVTCPPRRVIVDEASGNWDEFAQFNNCIKTTTPNRSIKLSVVKVCDNGTSSCYSIRNTECLYYGQEFGLTGCYVSGQGSTSTTVYWYNAGVWTQTTGIQANGCECDL